MYRHYIIKKSVLLTIILGSLFSERAFCQSDFEKSLKKNVDSLLSPHINDNQEYQQDYLLPNDALQSVTVPSGWGGNGTYVFGGFGGSYPQVYQKNADLIASGGFCIGDPVKAVNFAASLNMTDVHRFRDFSGNFIVSRVIPGGNSISIGALQAFATSKQSDAPGQTYYFAFSHTVQTLPSETYGSSKLTYTIGIGNGRFYSMSPADIASGKSKHGTAVFGGISYEVITHINLIAEWSGTNLGVSMGIRPFTNLLSIGFGIVNLTRYSATKPNAVFSIGIPLSLLR